MVLLKLLGGASLEDDAGPIVGPVTQRHRLALLAVLATARTSGVSRDKVAAWLWSESDTEHARNSLKQSVHAIRRALGATAVLSAGDELRLNPAALRCDVAAFRHAVDSGNAAAAAELYAGAFLDGFFLSDAPEFEEWVEMERARLRDAHQTVLDTLATAAESSGEAAVAAHWLRRLATELPGNSEVVLRLMQASAATGDRGNAIRHGQVHLTLLHEEFDAQADPDVVALMERLRHEPKRSERPGRSRNGAPAGGSATPVRGNDSERMLEPAAVPQPSTVVRAAEPADSHATVASAAQPADSHATVASAAQPADSRATASPPAQPVGPYVRAAASPRRRARFIRIAVPAAAVLAIAAVIGNELRGARGPDTSLAVLPFVDLSGSTSDAYFTDGMTEELIHALSQVDGLRVIARTSAFQFKGRSVDVRDVGRDLDVALVVEGSVRRDDDQVRITAQLISTKDGSHLWSQTYDRDLDDVLAVQGSIASSIASALRLQLTLDAPPAARHSSDREAYDLLLKGRHAFSQRTPAAARQAIQYYEQAVARDTGYALAWVGLAKARAALMDIAGVPPEAATPPARAAALRALQLDSTLAEPHALLGLLYTDDWQWEAARQAFARSLELESDEPDTYLSYSLYLDNMSRFEDALDATLRAQQLDPLSARASYNVAGSYLHLARFEPAIAEASRLIELHPTLSLGYDVLGWALVDAGRPAEAVAVLEKAVSLGGGRWLPLANLGRAYASVGRDDDAHKVLARLERDWGELGYGNFAMAAVHVALGERDAALMRLQQVYRLRHAKLPHTRQWAAFEPLYGDTAFSRIVREAGYEPPARSRRADERW